MKKSIHIVLFVLVTLITNITSGQSKWEMQKSGTAENLEKVHFLTEEASSGDYTCIKGEMDGILSKADSPYLAIDDVIVPDSKTLTIEPGRPNSL